MSAVARLASPVHCSAKGLVKTEYLDYFLIQSVVVINQIRQGLELDLSVLCQSNFYLRQHSNIVMDFGDKKLNGVSLLNIICKYLLCQLLVFSNGAMIFN